eukprot:COSAG04_NODE_6_length_47123_cov_87.347482_17_plen_106_part_00
MAEQSPLLAAATNLVMRSAALASSFLPFFLFLFAAFLDDMPHAGGRQRTNSFKCYYARRSVLRQDYATGARPNGSAGRPASLPYSHSPPVTLDAVQPWVSFVQRP